MLNVCAEDENETHSWFVYMHVAAMAYYPSVIRVLDSIDCIECVRRKFNPWDV